MTVRQLVWFIAAYIAIVALAIWFDLAVLCQGNAKFDGGCGGFAFYIPLWEIFLAPLPIAAILLELWRKATAPPITVLVAYLVGILFVTEVGFLLIEKFPVLLAVEAAAIGVASLIRWKTVKSRPETVRVSLNTPSLPLLTHLRELDAANWLRASLTTFGRTVSSILPGHFPAYVRVYHPFDRGDGSPSNASTWRDMVALAGVELSDPATAADFALEGVADAQARVGTLRPRLIEVLIEHLRTATATPDLCYFAIWEGFAGSAAPPTLTPKLELPHRAYHVFAGPLTAARTSYSNYSWVERSANLWWPADQAWCVATEVDFAWTYVGGPRECIDAVLADPRLEAVETSALARW